MDAAVAVEDYVIDLVIEVDGPPGAPERAMARLVVPGAECWRTAEAIGLAVTTVVAASGELAAVTHAHDAIAAQLEAMGAHVTSTAVVATSLGSLLALVDPHLPDEELERLDLVDLVERHLWNRPAWDYEAYVASERHRLAATA